MERLERLADGGCFIALSALGVMARHIEPLDSPRIVEDSSSSVRSSNTWKSRRPTRNIERFALSSR
jgi:hypothetical protein